MSSVKEHYDNHLAHFYSWMSGDFQGRVEEQTRFFVESVAIVAGQHALDLGCGHGIQSVALAQLGYEVTAVDFSKVLLDELKERSSQLPIQIVQGDLMDDVHFERSYPLIICMGDTLTHLTSAEEIGSLFKKISRSLTHGGKAILSFRELTDELVGDQRFIPVRADENQIHTCLLEYFPTHVRVSDILHVREGNSWKQKVSSYQKLRISVAQVKQWLTQAGLRPESEKVLNRMTYLVANK